MDTNRNYKYYDQIIVVYTSNQFRSKIEKGNNFDLENSSFESLKKVLEYYNLILEKEPTEQNQVLDNYLTLTEPELRVKVTEMMKN